MERILSLAGVKSTNVLKEGTQPAERYDHGVEKPFQGQEPYELTAYNHSSSASVPVRQVPARSGDNPMIDRSRKKLSKYLDEVELEEANIQQMSQDYAKKFNIPPAEASKVMRNMQKNPVQRRLMQDPEKNRDQLDQMVVGGLSSSDNQAVKNRLAQHIRKEEPKTEADQFMGNVVDGPLKNMENEPYEFETSDGYKIRVIPDNSIGSCLELPDGQEVHHPTHSHDYWKTNGQEHELENLKDHDFSGNDLEEKKIHYSFSHEPFRSLTSKQQLSRKATRAARKALGR